MYVRTYIHTYIHTYSEISLTGTSRGPHGKFQLLRVPVIESNEKSYTSHATLKVTFRDTSILIYTYMLWSKMHDATKNICRFSIIDFS